MGLFSFFKKDKEETEKDLGPNVEKDFEKCNGPDCAKCVTICPNFSFIVQDDKVVLKEHYSCRNCKKCMAICPNDCLNVV